MWWYCATFIANSFAIVQSLTIVYLILFVTQKRNYHNYCWVLLSQRMHTNTLNPWIFQYQCQMRSLIWQTNSDLVLILKIHTKPVTRYDLGRYAIWAISIYIFRLDKGIKGIRLVHYYYDFIGIGCWVWTRPTLERRATLGHFRYIKPNMINHFAN